ncbi:hypothetical protein DPEC_G00342150 [Dallia pectoralis]|uniref:Uncharacterized protein n=1 Tax=Dallia pectoralis TaxID=75939 RepID=A0ACC2F5N8_DALPE|nr:hypothetical protein DPEC_G00342150 [Dallia pectoralis]
MLSREMESKTPNKFQDQTDTESRHNLATTAIPVKDSNEHGDYHHHNEVTKVPVSEPDAGEMHSGDKVEQTCPAITNVRSAKTDNDDCETEPPVVVTKGQPSEPDAVQMSSGDNAEQPCTEPDAEQMGSGDNAEQPCREPDAEQMGSGDNAEQPCREPDAEQMGSGDNAEQPCREPDTEQMGSGDNAEQPCREPDTEQMSSGDNAEQPCREPDAEQMSSGDNAEQPCREPDTEQMSSGDNAEQPCREPDTEQMGSGDNAKQPCREPDTEQMGSGDNAKQPCREPDTEQMGSGDNAEQPCTESIEGQPVKPGDNRDVLQVVKETESVDAVTEVPVSEPDRVSEKRVYIFTPQSRTVRSSDESPTTRTRAFPYLYLMSWIGAVLVGLLAIYLATVLIPTSPENKEFNRTEIFIQEMAKVKDKFPGQRSELWRRTRIHLVKHLQTAQPKEPVSLMLTAGRRGEKTMHCLANRLGFSFAAALNASVLHINGSSKADQKSDLVKLDIDGQLQEAFEGGQPVAVIHRFEVLPPGSAIIFYRYCDHENSAYKKVFIIFTVLLADEEDLPANLGLSTVEEMVDDHLQARFVSSSQPAAHDMMDRDMFSGLWSRISHLVLPVAAETSLEQGVCV